MTLSCPKDKILNPLTGRCILKINSIKHNKELKKLLKEPCTDKHKIRSSFTGRCVQKETTRKRKSPKLKKLSKTKKSKSITKSKKSPKNKSITKSKNTFYNILIAADICDTYLSNPKYWTDNRLVKKYNVTTREVQISIEKGHCFK